MTVSDNMTASSSETRVCTAECSGIEICSKLMWLLLTDICFDIIFQSKSENNEMTETGPYVVWSVKTARYTISEFCLI